MRRYTIEYMKKELEGVNDVPTWSQMQGFIVLLARMEGTIEALRTNLRTTQAEMEGRCPSIFLDGEPGYKRSIDHLRLAKTYGDGDNYVRLMVAKEYGDGLLGRISILEEYMGDLQRMMKELKDNYYGKGEENA